MAYWSGIAFIVEDLLPVVIGRPTATAAVVPAGDACIGSGPKRNAVGHSALPFFPLKRVLSRSEKFLTPAHQNDWVQKRHIGGTDHKQRPPLAALTLNGWTKRLILVNSTVSRGWLTSS